MKKDAGKIRTTSISVYLSNRRKLALGSLANEVSGGSIAQLITDLLENAYGERLDEIEKNIVVPNSSDASKQHSSDRKESALHVA